MDVGVSVKMAAGSPKWMLAAGLRGMFEKIMKGHSLKIEEKEKRGLNQTSLFS